MIFFFLIICFWNEFWFNLLSIVVKSLVVLLLWVRSLLNGWGFLFVLELNFLGIVNKIELLFGSNLNVFRLNFLFIFFFQMSFIFLQNFVLHILDIIIYTQLIKMINLEFEIQESQTSYPKKLIKKDYSAGFKNQTKAHLSKNIVEKVHQRSIFDSLNIGNLKELYQQSKIKPENKSLIKKVQSEAVNRLCMTKQKKSQKQNNGVTDQNPSVNQEDKIERFVNAFHRDQNFQIKAKENILNKIIIKIHQKLQNIYVANKIKNMQVEQEFQDSFLNFFIQNYDMLLSKRKIQESQLLLSYQNYLQAIKQKFLSKQTYVSEEFRAIIFKNPFFYFFFEIQFIKIEEFDLKDFKSFIRKSKGINHIKFGENLKNIDVKEFTVPYQSHVSEQVKDIEKPKGIEQKNNIYIFKANPIPKTVYQKPKLKEKRQLSSTKLKPFNLTVSKQNKLSADELYQWNRNFEAKTVPKTTYEPSLIQNNVDDTKMRALALLDKAEYPSNMKYLESYNNFKQEEIQKISKKYQKTVKTLQVKEIPNFIELQRRQLLELEQRKLQNTKNTEMVPFKLHENKPKVKQDNYMVLQEEKIDQEPKQFKEKIGRKEPLYQPKSTLKFDAYVKMLKNERQQKQQKIKYEQYEEEKRRKKMSHYTSILKQRIDDEVRDQYKDKPQQDHVNRNIMKVDYETIYNYEPLLIQRENQKNQHRKEPYSNTFTPII